MLKSFAITVSAAVLLSVAPASATIVKVDSQNYNLGGDSAWKEDNNGGTVNPVYETGFAGAYNIKVDGVNAQAFCIDLFLGLAVPGTYNNETKVAPTSNTLADMTRVSRAAWIFSDVFPNIAALAASNNTNQQTIAVALQFALWEILVDGANQFTLNDGYFQKASSGPAGPIDYTKATTLAGTFAAAHTGAVDATKANLSVILVDTGFTGAVGSAPQRLIYYPGSAVPEPGTLAMFGSALVGLGLIARRRQA